MKLKEWLATRPRVGNGQRTTMDYFALLEEWKSRIPSESEDERVRIFSAKALCETPDCPSPYENGMQWGPWRFDARTLTLTHTFAYGNGSGYEIDLEDITSSAAMLDWIFQVSTKDWCTREDAGCLLAAFHALFRPQENLCSMGVGRRLNPTRYLKERMKK